MLLPEKHDPDVYVIRTDFSNAGGWQAICHAISESANELEMQVQFIENQEFDGASPQELLPMLEGNAFYSFAFLIDRVSIESPEFPILVLDLFTEPGRTFRAIPTYIPSIHANLWLANMDFEDYADSVDPNGIFRGFPDE